MLEVLHGIPDDDVRQIAKALAVLALTDDDIERMKAKMRVSPAPEGKT